jgi:hypothetical protein
MRSPPANRPLTARRSPGALDIATGRVICGGARNLNKADREIRTVPAGPNRRSSRQQGGLLEKLREESTLFEYLRRLVEADANGVACVR